MSAPEKVLLRPRSLLDVANHWPEPSQMIKPPRALMLCCALPVRGAASQPLPAQFTHFAEPTVAEAGVVQQRPSYY